MEPAKQKVRSDGCVIRAEQPARRGSEPDSAMRCTMPVSRVMLSSAAVFLVICVHTMPLVQLCD
jgi:hypothetical protein